MTKVKIFRIASLSTLLSTIFFYKVNVNFNEYIFIAFVFLVFSALSYRCFYKNRNFASLFISITLPNLIAFLLLKFVDDYRPVWDCTDILYTLYFLFLIIIIVFVLGGGKEEKHNIENLFIHRERELKKIESLLKETNIIGLDASWGDGKSFLMQLFAQKQGKKTKTHIINISVLASTIETIESYIISEISNFLEENFIFSYSSPKIKKFFSQPLLKNWSFCFDEKNSYSELFSSLVKDVQTLKKTIILSFEDLERIRDDKIILKVFNISDKINYECNKIGCDCIKIIYQYDKKELINLLKLEQKPNYLEKYIPCEIKLSPIPFLESLKVFIERNHYKNITVDDFTPIFSPIRLYNNFKILFRNHYKSFQQYRHERHIAEDIFHDRYEHYIDEDFLHDRYERYNDEDIPHTLYLRSFSLRKNILFLKDTEFLLSNEFFKENKKTIIIYNIIKYFYPSLFHEIEFGQPLYKTLTITLNIEGKTTYLNLQEFNRLFRKEASIINSELERLTKEEEKERDLVESKSSLSIQKKEEELHKISVNYYKKKIPFLQRAEESPFNIINFNDENLDKFTIINLLNYQIDDSYIYTIEEKENINAIDGLIWSLKYAGASGYTKNKELLLEFEKIIDSTDNFEIKKNKYNNILFKTALSEDYIQTKHSQEEFIIILLDIYEKDLTKWKKAINFFTEYHSNKITDDIFPIFSRLTNAKKAIFLYAIEKFSSLKTEYTFSDGYDYLNLLRGYLEQIKSLVFFSKQNLNQDCFWWHRYNKKDLQSALINILGEVDSTLSQNLNIKTIVNECKIIKKFIEKNIEFINAPLKPKNEEVDKQTNKNDEKEQLKKYLTSTTKEELDKLIEENYSKNKLSLGEIKEIREKYEEKTVGLKSKLKRTRNPSRTRSKKE